MPHCENVLLSRWRIHQIVTPKHKNLFENFNKPFLTQAICHLYTILTNQFNFFPLLQPQIIQNMIIYVKNKKLAGIHAKLNPQIKVGCVLKTSQTACL